MDEYQKYFTDSKNPKITNLSLLPEDREKPTYRRVKVIYEAIDDKGKAYKVLAYYTLINEDGKWKILWVGKLKELASDQLNKGFYDEAIKRYEEILSVDPYDGEAYEYIGWCYMREGKGEKAISNIKKAIAIEPDEPAHYNAMTSYYYNKKLYSLAVENIKKAISFEYGSDSDMSAWYGNLSISYAEQKDYKNALEAVNKAVELYPNNVHALWHKGAILLGTKGVKQGAVEAKEMFLKALETNEKNKEKLEGTLLGQIYYRLAIVENFLKDYSNAKKHIMQALEIDPEDKDYQKIYYAIKINE